MDETDTESSLVQYKEFIDITVEANFASTDREKFFTIALKTNSISFSSQQTSVRRRYSDFIWLRRNLEQMAYKNTRIPTLPRRQLTFWNLSDKFYENRRRHLEKFLQRVVKETIFLSSSALHLFLQTELTTNEMEKCIKTGCVSSELTKHVNRLEAVQFSEMMQTSKEVEESCSIASIEEKVLEKSNNTDVSWSMNRQTARRISNLPQFSTFLENFHGSLEPKE